MVRHRILEIDDDGVGLEAGRLLEQLGPVPRREQGDQGVFHRRLSWFLSCASAAFGRAAHPPPQRVAIAERQQPGEQRRSEEHTSELQSLMRISSAVFCLKKKTTNIQNTRTR